MRTSKLNILFSSTSLLDKVGPKLKLLLNKLLIKSHNKMATEEARVIDVLFHMPNSFVNRKIRANLNEAKNGEIASFEVIVEKHIPPPRKRIPYRVNCIDDEGTTIILAFFKPHKQYLEEVLIIGEKAIISGQINLYGKNLQMIHPDYIIPTSQKHDLPQVEPIYPLTDGLSNKIIIRTIKSALTKLPDIREWLDQPYISKKNWPSFNKALKLIHNPQNAFDQNHYENAKERLVYDDLLARQLALSLVRYHTKKQGGNSIKGNFKLRNKIISSLPFELTNSQKNSLKEIYLDMADETSMLRLLQGDVGSGKTIIALLALANAVEDDYQGAILAPTEILVNQHLSTLKPLCEEFGIRVEILTARLKKAERKKLLNKLQKGLIDILIGTHAILNDDVVFSKLGLVIVDEQHRFGVHQRLRLTAKGFRGHTDLLAMTATPIPRTLSLTNYGDMDVSRITEKPKGRQKIETTAMPLERLGDLIEAAKRALDNDTQIYWVCPLVEESEAIDLSAAEDRYQMLEEIFGPLVGLVHGKMKKDDIDITMDNFIQDKIKILVATTVIEVGVNVPNASIMIIEHAERFGLAQLHQLRGRVGRGEIKSSCVLLYQSPLSKVALERINIMRKSEDGFLIAEKDLELRGSGDLLGARQSGNYKLLFADLFDNRELLYTAYDDARLIVAKDPFLQSKRGAELKNLLHVFEYNDSAKILASG